MPELAALAEEFRYAGDALFGDSPLYRYLARRIAGEPDLLAVAAAGMPGQSRVLLLLAAVHFQILRGAEHPLAWIYRELASPPSPPPPGETAAGLGARNGGLPAALWPAFLDFAGEHRGAIREFVATSRVQTNELGRAVYFRLGAEWLAERYRPPAISWIELGASAGLNLHWDYFAMEFSRPSRRWLRGDVASGVHLRCSLEGSESPAERGAEPPPVVERLGIDVAPPDVRDEAGFLRLAAFVWADQAERLLRLRKAVELFRHGDHAVLRADATRDLAALCDRLAPDTLICLAQIFLSCQLPTAARTALDEHIAEVSRRRELVRLAVEWVDHGAELAVEHWRDGRRLERCAVARRGHPQGRELHWEG